jgi:hypothetical protein
MAHCLADKLQLHGGYIVTFVVIYVQQNLMLTDMSGGSS